jgi:purine-binding chemotaxis protein CheW
MVQQADERDGTFLASTFYLGDTLLGIDTLRVQEIIKVSDITSVHHGPECVLGVINLRGRIVTVLDLGRQLGFPFVDVSDESRIIIVDWDDEYVGLLVDAISDVITADRDSMMPAPSNVGEAQERFFQGVYRVDEGLIAILDVEEVLSLDDK